MQTHHDAPQVRLHDTRVLKILTLTGSMITSLPSDEHDVLVFAAESSRVPTTGVLDFLHREAKEQKCTQKQMKRVLPCVHIVLA